MAIVTLELPHLSSEAKKRLGDRILYAMQQEGIAPASTVMMFRPVSDDLYLDGILVEAEPVKASAPPVFSLAPAPTPAPASPAIPASAGTVGRKPKASIDTAREQLRLLLNDRRSINSFEAQKAFEKANLECSPATLRRLFQELEMEGLVARTGNKRGTRYLLKAPEKEKAPAPIKLVKAESREE